MKCPKCDTEMKEVKKDESRNAKTDKKYLRAIYHCEKDDVWLGLEVPKTS